MIEFLKNQQTTIFAILGGMLPAIFWLWFWLYEEDREKTAQRIIIFLSFIVGAILVVIAIWMEKYSLNFIKDNTTQIITWAIIEELLKFIGVTLIIFRNDVIKKPIDYPMYFIAVALGFAAVENTLYLLNPVGATGTVVAMLTGNLRFLGSTLLHAIASAIIGSSLGLAYYIKSYKIPYLFFGIISAIALHSIFNFFIMKGSGENFLSVFGILWVVAIINILVFEKLKRMGNNIS
jgi:protease PrsW